jgi:hypothetical protein
MSPRSAKPAILRVFYPGTDTEELASLMLTAHGANDDVAVRAQDIRDSIQRFQWAMERRQSKVMSA